MRARLEYPLLAAQINCLIRTCHTHSHTCTHTNTHAHTSTTLICQPQCYRDLPSLIFSVLEYVCVTEFTSFFCCFIFSEICTEGQRHKAKLNFPEQACYKLQTVNKMFCVIVSVYLSFCPGLKLTGDCNFAIAGPYIQTSFPFPVRLCKQQHIQIITLRLLAALLSLTVCDVVLVIIVLMCEDQSVDINHRQWRF